MRSIAKYNSSIRYKREKTIELDEKALLAFLEKRYRSKSLTSIQHKETAPDGCA